MSKAVRFLGGLASVLVPAVIGAYVYQRYTSSPQAQRSLSKTPKGKERVTVLYGTTTGTARMFAERLAKRINQNPLIQNFYEARALNLSTYNHEDEMPKEGFVFLLCSTWSEGTAPESCREFFEWLQDFAYDFRVSKDHLAKVKFALFGLGSAYYDVDYCKHLAAAQEHLVELGATALEPMRRGDDQTDLENKFEKWEREVMAILRRSAGPEQVVNKGGPKRVTVASAPAKSSKRIAKEEAAAAAVATSAASNTTTEEDDELEEEDRVNNMFVTMDLAEDDVKKEINENLLPPDSTLYDTDSDSGDDENNDDDMLDMEDIGDEMSKPADEQSSSCGSGGGGGCGEEKDSKTPPEMVTKLQRKALTKEGYKIIGTHSAVKLCRWTKNQMRGRGGCYKHTFYGITSYQCMEATPSLACANKCVFCWRHHKNPVGTEWRWKEDEPDYIVNEAVESHRSMINEMRGVPGVKPERLLEGFDVKHCALSLVGEPIMYPRINEMLGELHKRKISTFLVTNAQFPAEIKALCPVTQLYVSVDASNKESLKAIDRPLFKDYWERFTGALKALESKRQRTVYRLTLVSGWNMDEIEGYAKLIETGLPDFIEIKAVTYCGKSDASSLTMQNVPWHK
jgi:tRNA wybutosine-synthesizing protein 1